MKRLITMGLAASAVALLVVACDDSADSYGYGGTGYASCATYTTCASCTPVLGCGWCSFSNGSGACASEPDQCANKSSFGWTWEPVGCHVPADASVAPSDASHASQADASHESDASQADASQQDAAGGD
jgi:hypothetical protein